MMQVALLDIDICGPSIPKWACQRAKWQCQTTDLVLLGSTLHTHNQGAHVFALLAYALLLQVGLLDIDICGPSIPKMLGLEGEEIHQSNAGWSPVYVEDNLGVMSIGMSCMMSTVQSL